jgi:hypothetical protein
VRSEQSATGFGPSAGSAEQLAARRGPVELAPNGKAAEEVRALWAWVRHKLDGSSLEGEAAIAANG